MNYDRNYKASVFSMLYEYKENIMDLYNGIYDDKCTDPNEITINTLKNEDGVEGGIFAKFKNDLSFIFGAYLNLFEHQSTINRNIPLRMLIYVAKLLSSMVETKKLYREKAVSIPAPRFVVFYNGEKDAPEKETLRLSAQYGAQVEEPELELKVTVYNINTDKGCEVLAKCRTLREYMVFVDRVRQGMAGINDETEKRKVMEEVVDDCIKDGILEKLLKERREEIIMVSILQYDQAAHEAALHEDGYDEGHDAGYDEGHDAGYDEGHDAGYDEGHDVGYDEGEVCIQIDLIRKKIEKGKSHQLIADEIEKEIAFVDEICSIADSISPEFDVKKICVEYMSRHRKDEDGHMSLL